MSRNKIRTGWRAKVFGEGGVIVPYERVREGHLMMEHEGALLDLGPCTLEDLRLIAFVTQEAAVRLPSKRGRSRATPQALSRVRNLTRQFWQASLDPDNRRRRLPQAFNLKDLTPSPEKTVLDSSLDEV